MKKYFVVLIVVIISNVSCASLIQWEQSDGGNGHYYEVVTAPSVTWSNAQADAESKGGYLATITLEEEQEFIFNLLLSSTTQTGGYWIGMLEGEEGGYGWVTGEDYSYSNWCPGQPDNWGNGNENRVHILWTETESESTFSRRGTWNDVVESGYGGFYPHDVARAGYIIEVVPEPVTISLFALGGIILRKRIR